MLRRAARRLRPTHGPGCWPGWPSRHASDEPIWPRHTDWTKRRGNNLPRRPRLAPIRSTPIVPRRTAVQSAGDPRLMRQGMVIGALLLVAALAAVTIHPNGRTFVSDMVARVSTLTGAGMVAMPTTAVVADALAGHADRRTGADRAAFPPTRPSSLPRVWPRAAAHC